MPFGSVWEVYWCAVSIFRQTRTLRCRHAGAGSNPLGMRRKLCVRPPGYCVSTGGPLGCHCGTSATSYGFGYPLVGGSCRFSYCTDLYWRCNRLELVCLKFDAKALAMFVLKTISTHIFARNMLLKNDIYIYIYSIYNIYIYILIFIYIYQADPGSYFCPLMEAT